MSSVLTSSSLRLSKAALSIPGQTLSWPYGVCAGYPVPLTVSNALVVTDITEGTHAAGAGAGTAGAGAGTPGAGTGTLGAGAGTSGAGAGSAGLVTDTVMSGQEYIVLGCAAFGTQ